MRKIVWVYCLLSPLVFVVVTLLLGFYTPGYSHLAHTISHLAVGRYGRIQELNFLQFALLALCLSFLVKPEFESEMARKIWARFCFVLFFFFLTIIVFPADAFAMVKPADFIYATLSGKIHFSATLLLFILSPFGLYFLARAFTDSPRLKSFSTPTLWLGGISFLLSMGWILFFSGNLLPLYLGALQKSIAAVCIAWTELLIWRVRPK